MSPLNMTKETAFLAPSSNFFNNHINSMIQTNPIKDKQQVKLPNNLRICSRATTKIDCTETKSDPEPIKIRVLKL